MKRFTLATIAISAVMATSAYAEGEKTCDTETFSMVIAEVENARADRKEAAIEELKMAQLKLEEGDNDACAVHLENASKAATIG
ncbi:hypothetical protein F9L33_13965 [Amylibacter sp. SFDW26]|uniref:hypothetical protein n=1 Tax=Amylibacter sp. SFDW26 TaxID=2652722 RepID=UPI0012617413|nr:hypothetical protein [Amylibacter sp. SFDW26]KAB7610403.1 hypothetical protein F9L33_13965 [Amylibacter sp. SFDW26]